MTLPSTTAARISSAALVVAIVASASTGRAQGRDPVAAEAAFAEAKALMQHGRFAEACPKLEASQSLDPALGTLLNLGDCYEKVGKTASAWVRYREASALALEKGQREREAIARERAAAIEPRLCRLVIRVAEQPDVTVLRDGAVVAKAAYGIGVPVDPGAHRVEARGGGAASFSNDVEVVPANAGGACAATVVEVPVLGEASAVGPKPVLQPIDLTPDAPAPPPARRWGAMHTLAVVTAGLGIVGVGVGSVFGLSASGTKSDADAQCVPAGCTPEGKALLADAGGAADASTVAFSVGAVLLVTGAVLWLTSPSLR